MERPSVDALEALFEHVDREVAAFLTGEPTAHGLSATLEDAERRLREWGRIEADRVRSARLRDAAEALAAAYTAATSPEEEEALVYAVGVLEDLRSAW